MTEALPFVSVIMPVLNEARFIERALGAVLCQDYPSDHLEVWVVDGGSTDNTRELVAAMCAADNRARLLDNPGRIQACALNIGIRAARGDVFARVDGHTIIAPDYVRRCIHHLHTSGADNVGGPQRVVGHSATGRAIAAAYRSPFGVPSRFTTGTHAGYVDTVYLGTWPRDVFDRVGLFNETLAANEDYEFNYRIRRAGGRIYLAPDIRADYIGRPNLGALWQQYHQYGRWKFAMLRQHPASLRPRQLAAPLLVAAVTLGTLFTPLHAAIRRLWIGTLTLYALVNGIASLHAAQRSEWALLLRLPLVFATMHMAWGSGFWRAALNMLGERLARL